jgi:hypothetical protein
MISMAAEPPVPAAEEERRQLTALKSGPTAAEESLDLLAHLAASLLDVSRLQAGTLMVFR